MRFRLTRAIPLALLALTFVGPAAGDALAQTPAKLLLQSISVTTNDQEYIAVYNPNDTAVDLSDYYITDAVNSTANTNYAYIVNPAAGTPGGAGSAQDFHIRFPAGASIAAHDTVAIAHRGAAAFVRGFGRKPAYEVVLPAGGDDPAVPNMLPAFTGSVNADPTLSNSGESVVLYYWNGQTDLVTDMDYVLWGSPENPTSPGNPSSYVVDKTGISVDGPDGDATPTGYLPETPWSGQDSVATTHSPGEAFRRTDFTEGLQATTGGNGVEGSDETSENLAATWTVGPASPPFADITEPPAELTADSGGPYTGTVNSPIQFDGSASTPAEGETITNYAWTFGDGGTATGVNPTHTYTAANTYTVTLTVTGSGASGTQLSTTTATVSPVSGGGGPAQKLLFQSVSIAGDAQEYIAIYNPNNDDVDLTNFYITDAIFTNQFYPYIVDPASRTPAKAGGGTFNDFHIRFPPGSTIAAHDTVAVAHRGATEFSTTYGRKPAFETVSPTENDPTVPDMLEAFPGSVPDTLSLIRLSNGAESLTLYYWDGETDLVTDIDYIHWGAITDNNNRFRVDKTGFSIDGPDAGTTPTSYQPDTPKNNQSPVPSVSDTRGHDDGNAFRREDNNEGTQVTTGGNGFNGRDETSENLATTWSNTNPAAPPFVKGGSQPAQLTARPGGPYGGTVNTPIQFNGSGSTPAEGETITNYAWTFGDGGTATGANPTHTYTAAGSYPVTLTVTGSGGSGTHSASTTANVSGGGTGGEAKKLLLQAVAVTTNPQEYIAIYNPNNETVDLSNYYISDAIHQPETSYIWIANRNVPGMIAGGGTFSDFHVRFPAGATIAAHDTIAIAHQGATRFQESYGRDPAFEIPFATSSDPDVPDMRMAFPGSVPGVPDSTTLSNAGEDVMVYYWDGQTDLVTDIEYIVWGGQSGTTFFNDKTGKCVDGPDADAVCSLYNSDTPTASQAVIQASGAHANGNAFRREDFNEGTQRTTGGNGVGGRDETSENLNVTWSSNQPAAPPFVKGTAPPPPGQLTAVPGGPYNGQPGQVITFNGNQSTPKTGETITAYVWNFGDNTSNGTGVTVQHTYAAPGTYTVTLTVTGSGGGTHSATTTARITEPGSGPLQIQARTFLPTLHEQFPIVVDPAGVGGDNVTLRIFDLDGREVKLLHDGDLSTKRTFSWDGHDDELMIVPAGTYICHLEIRDDNGRVHSFTAPIVVARRLERN